MDTIFFKTEDYSLVVEKPEVGLPKLVRYDADGEVVDWLYLSPERLSELVGLFGDLLEGVRLSSYSIGMSSSMGEPLGYATFEFWGSRITFQGVCYRMEFTTFEGSSGPGKPWMLMSPYRSQIREWIQILKGL